MKQSWTLAWRLALVVIAYTPEAERLTARAEDPPRPTREFAIRDSRAFLGGQPVDLWGLRCGNALYSTAVTERHINNFNSMVAHGINMIGVYIQGPNAGWPNPDAGLDGFRRDGRLRPEVAERLEWLIREADRRGMVVQVGLISPRKDQNLYDEAAIRTAMQETGRFLTQRGLRNVFVDLVHEYDHPDRIDHPILREPNGDQKKAKLTRWFKEAAPDIEVGVCPNYPSETGDTYPGMDVRIIEKKMSIPSEGFVVNIETSREDAYENDGVFNPRSVDSLREVFQSYLDAPHAVMLFHSSYTQGITNKSGTAPHPEAGGYGTSPTDRGIRFYYDWVRDHVGRYEYPRHVKDAKAADRVPISPPTAADSHGGSK